jgi:hypothetical protein
MTKTLFLGSLLRSKAVVRPITPALLRQINFVLNITRRHDHDYPMTVIALGSDVDGIFGVGLDCSNTVEDFLGGSKLARLFSSAPARLHAQEVVGCSICGIC